MPNRNLSTTGGRSKHAKRLQAAMQPRVVSHRAGTKAAKAHLFVREHREENRADVVAQLQKKFGLTESTARNWFQNFKTSLPDVTPAARSH